jgi:hypothetical protein
MNATGAGFHAAVGDLEHARLAPNTASAGHPICWSTSLSSLPTTPAALQPDPLTQYARLSWLADEPSAKLLVSASFKSRECITQPPSQ